MSRRQVALRGYTKSAIRPNDPNQIKCLVESSWVRLSRITRCDRSLRCDSTGYTTDLVDVSSSRRVLNISESIASNWVELNRIGSFGLITLKTATDPVLNNEHSYLSGTQWDAVGRTYRFLISPMWAKWNRLNLNEVIPFPTLYHTCKSMQLFLSNKPTTVWNRAV